MAFDPPSGKIILFGGLDNSFTALQDTWAYDAVDNTWTEVIPATSPDPRYFASMAYDPPSNTIILFGGVDGSSNKLNDTWAYNGVENTWTQLNPTTTPSIRSSASMSYDPPSGTLILFWGSTVGTYLNDTWAYNGVENTWTEVTPATSPSLRGYASMAFDPISNEVILFSGLNDVGVLDDTWAYNGIENTWTQLNPTTFPSGRLGAPMVFDPPSSTIILFGGTDIAVYYAETWAFIVQTAPQIISSDSTTFQANEFSSFTVLTTGIPIPSIALTGNLPSGINFVDNGDGTGTLSGTPISSGAGTYALTFTAANEVTPDAQQNFTLNIASPKIASTTTTTLIVNPYRYLQGEFITFTASVDMTSAAGSVTFFDGVKLLGVRMLSNGQATLTTDSLSPGKHFITASYSGDDSNLGSISSIIIVHVKRRGLK